MNEFQRVNEVEFVEHWKRISLSIGNFQFLKFTFDSQKPDNDLKSTPFSSLWRSHQICIEITLTDCSHRRRPRLIVSKRSIKLTFYSQLPFCMAKGKIDFGSEGEASGLRHGLHPWQRVFVLFSRERARFLWPFYRRNDPNGDTWSIKTENLSRREFYARTWSIIHSCLHGTARIQPERYVPIMLERANIEVRWPTHYNIG